MKEICIEAKQRISNCMLASSSGNGSPVSTSWRSTHLHNPPMRSTSAYDSMERPFRWDKKRGRWANSADFYFACTCHAFSSMIFSEILVHALMFGGWKFLLLSYSLAIAFYALPTFIIQTFLGQFSTSGSISAFRVSPIFKGIGYSILLVNITTVPYYIITSAVPFVYAVHSLHNTLPWMSCNNTWNTANCSVHDKYNAEDDIQDPHSTVEFFRSVISSTSKDASAITISWSILLGALIVGFVAIAILLKHVSFIGKVLRCICVLMFGFFLAIFANVLIQQKLSLHNFEEYLHPMLENSTEGIFGAVRCAMLMATFVLGPGWGSVITLSSYNSFRTDSERLSLWICLTHVLICLMALLAGSVAFDHFELHVVFQVCPICGLSSSLVLYS
ncbi:sodium-dependent serotonin transporter-like isoform X2 [Scaptodrosophila lebanonensis]|uniref:Sodium-dependent serotonin transporter-like isoform X2 n=1 Tax=Drosophila lebanonensis TaxID=7225 RepID=A0A6J2UAD8_DROLE|nr:sodium-dependent serotonin transporter-like isoform X2 [Scaptodrosophila lebanonensis]